MNIDLPFEVVVRSVSQLARSIVGHLYHADERVVAEAFLAHQREVFAELQSRRNTSAAACLLCVCCQGVRTGDLPFRGVRHRDKDNRDLDALVQVEVEVEDEDEDED